MAPPVHVSQMATAFLSPAALEAASPDVLGTSWMRVHVADDAHHVAGGTDDGELDVFQSLVLVVLVPDGLFPHFPLPDCQQLSGCECIRTRRIMIVGR